MVKNRGHWLHGISQRKANTVRAHIYVESQKKKIIDTERKLMVARGWELGMGKMGEGVKRYNSQL